MSSSFTRLTGLTLLGLGVLNASNARAAGFEKAISWSAKWAGLGGAAAAGVQGADSLFYNPAGLSSGYAREVSANVSPTFSEFKGPLTSQTDQQSSDRGITPIFGALAKIAITENLSVGFGSYVAAGTNASFENIDFSRVNANYDTLKPTIKSSLSMIEHSIGAGYKFNENWSVGASWRINQVQGEVSQAVISNNVLVAVQLKNLRDTEFGGYRLGAQYLSSSKNWGFGTSFRSKINFAAKGTSTGQYELPIPGQPARNLVGGGDVTMSNSLPYQVSLGGFSRLGDNFVLHSEYVFTDYSSNRRIDVSGKPLTIPIANINVIRNIDQGWKDQSNYKVGLEFNGIENVSLRTGYALTTQVTPTSGARATFASPGLGHAVTLGVGSNNPTASLLWDLALETSFASGKSEAVPGVEQSYSSRAYVAHTSLKYHF